MFTTSESKFDDSKLKLSRQIIELLIAADLNILLICAYEKLPSQCQILKLYAILAQKWEIAWVLPTPRGPTTIPQWLEVSAVNK